MSYSWYPKIVCLVNILSAFETWLTGSFDFANFCMLLLLLEKFLRCVQTLCVALCIAPNSPFHKNAVMNYALYLYVFFRPVMRNNRLKIFSSNNKVIKIKKIFKCSINLICVLYFSYPTTDSTHIVDSQLKLILGLIWLLILHYSISMPVWDDEGYADDDDKSVRKKTPKEKLLGWIQNKVPEVPIRNFNKDWNDGRAIGALVDSVAPGMRWGKRCTLGPIHSTSVWRNKTHRVLPNGVM